MSPPDAVMKLGHHAGCNGGDSGGPVSVLSFLVSSSFLRVSSAVLAIFSTVLLVLFIFSFAWDLFLHGTSLGLDLRYAAQGRSGPCGGGRTWNLKGLPGSGLVTLFKATCFVLLHARAPWTPLT